MTGSGCEVRRTGLRSRSPATILVGALVGLSMLAAACQSSSPGPSHTGGGGGGPTTTDAGPGGTSSPATSAPASPSPPPPPVSAARLRITPANGDPQAGPDAGITVAVTDGRITHVVAKAGGEPVPGVLEPDGSVWHSEWALATSTSYTVHATAVDAAGLSVKKASSFETLTPTQTFSTQIYEGFHKTYGVGMPVILKFSQAIENRAAVERSLELRTSKPVVGAWTWDGDATLYFRPRGYWPADTSVSFVGHLDGVEGAPGVFGVHTLTQDFHIGRSLIAVASTTTHHMQVFLDGKPYATWPISTGKPGDETANGTYLTITKANPEEMIGEDYDILVPWSVRITYSGAFVHAAPWSIHQQGSENVSHGCVNLAPDNAETYYKMSFPGDPVTITDSPRGGVWDNGWTVWFLSWKDVLKGSALHQAVKAGPDGSSFVGPFTLPPDHRHSPLGGSSPNNSDPV
jgi:lipoprotein-anchoring transpeptidase ErfK/SrfK